MSNRKLSAKRRALLCELEAIIGNLCYGSFIQNYGPNGVWESEGRWIRYPVTFEVEEAEIKTKFPCSEEILDSMLLEGFYKFGANHLHIMEALDNILACLEKRYSISFD